MTNTVEIHVDGETVSIEVDELSSLEQMRWAAKAPNQLIDKDGDEDVLVTPGLMEFVIDLTTSRTVLTESLLEEIPQEELTRLIEGVIAYSFGEEPPEEKEQTIDFDDNGAVDLDEWR